MPSRNSIKVYKPETMYHLYNRGVEGRKIFLDERDYAVFLNYLRGILLPDNKAPGRVDKSLVSEATRYNPRLANLSAELELVAFCLMPNHFHLLVYQEESDSITKLMRSVGTAYSMYFNKRYRRKGTLFQGRYKGSKIDNQEYWLHVSRYIHLNPVDISVNHQDYERSSYRAYLGRAKIEWLKPGRIFECFGSIREYENFVEEYKERRTELKEIEKVLGI